MAEGQVPQRVVPLHQPLLSAGKCQWSYVDVFGCALHRWKTQHVKFTWKLLFLMNFIWRWIYMKFTWQTPHKILMWLYCLKFDICKFMPFWLFFQLIIFVYTWFHSFNKILHKWRSLGFYIQTTHPFLKWKYNKWIKVICWTFNITFNAWVWAVGFAQCFSTLPRMENYQLCRIYQKIDKKYILVRR